MEIDVIGMDKKIREKWVDAQQRLHQITEEIASVEELLTQPLSIAVRHDVVERRRALETEQAELHQILQNQHFYTMEASELLEQFQRQVPKKISFMARTVKPEPHSGLIGQYLDILKKYEIQLPEVEEHTQKSEKRTCIKCKSTELVMNQEQNLEICEQCGFQEEKSYKSMSFKDISRVNLSNKYTYERRVHFKDCMNQYQGKQNATIDDKVIHDLEEQLTRHGLLLDSPHRRTRFQNVTKEHILLFLKETGHTKHYEDIVLIYHKMTGKPVDNISHLESVLMEDFDKISSLYDTKYKFTGKIERKSFINTQYVLFQLLRRHKYPCRKEDFNMLKTLDRKSFHDEIVRDLFETLGFNFTPIF